MTWLKWKLVLVRLEIVVIISQDGCTFASNIPQAQKLFWTRAMDLLGDVGHVESRIGMFGERERVLVSAQDRCTVCAKHTTGSEIILDT
jgi:hypothetical protein